jgi:hypothetical protein
VKNKKWSKEKKKQKILTSNRKLQFLNTEKLEQKYRQIMIIKWKVNGEGW